MGRGYRQFSYEERIEIAYLSGEGRSIRQIAAALGRAPSSVARELKRNRGSQVGYAPAYADQQAKARHWIGSKLDRDAVLRERLLNLLAAGWSPEQVAGRSGREGLPGVGVETIYRFIHAQIARHNDYSWRNYLPRQKARRGRRSMQARSPASLHRSARAARAQACRGFRPAGARPLGSRPYGLLPLRPEPAHTA